MTPERSRLGQFRDADVSGRPMEWKASARQMFQAFHASRTVEGKLSQGAINPKSGPDEFKRLFETAEASEHAESMIASLEKAATARGWAVCFLQPRIVESLPGSANLAGALGCLVLGLVNPEGRISPIAFDAHNALYQIHSGAWVCRYDATIEFERELGGLEKLGIGKTFI